MTEGESLMRAGSLRRSVAVAATVMAFLAGGVTMALGSPPAGAASPKPLTIVVTNDDGYNAPGIDTVVQALRKLPKVTVKVVAPATNQSGTGGKTTPGTLVTTNVKTLSGYPAVAVQGYPADTIRAALDQLNIKPNLVVSGINFGQNLGPVADLSGTVGAARAAAARGIPAVASSQGLGSPVAYPVTAKAVITWINSHRSKLAVTKQPKTTIVNINGPSCGTTGSPRGTVNAPPGTTGNPLAPSDCSSTATDPPDDVTALAEGFIVVDTLPATAATTTTTTTSAP
jgi:5'-nucleotidase